MKSDSAKDNMVSKVIELMTVHTAKRGTPMSIPVSQHSPARVHLRGTRSG